MTKTLMYDYVIVGGGAAGCVIAARLAAESGKTVALLERGRMDTNRWIHIPGTFFKVLQSQDADAVVSEPDPSIDHRPFPVPQGRVLGGGSSVNGMIYMRGQRQDFDDWAEEHGCTGWRYKDVLPVFKRQEGNQVFGDAFHGQDGLLKVDAPNPKHPVCTRLIEAAQACGLPRTQDFNGATQEGVGWYQVTAHDGLRQSAAACFLRPHLGRENLSVITGVQVQRLQIVNRRATAIEGRAEDGSALIVQARREIILSAGSFHSPRLLMLSGIGPQDELDRHGIEIVHQSEEVGRNYHDHIGTPVTRRLKGAKGLHGADKGLAALKNGFDYYLRGRKGLLASNLLQAGACVDTSGAGRPDVQFNLAPFAAGPPGTPPLDFHGMQVTPMTMRPKSRGRLGLRSKDPSDAPKFVANALSDPADLDTLRRGVRLAQDIFAQMPLADILGEEVWPGPDVSTTIGSNTFDDAIRAQARTIFHPAGTCRMGPSPSAVVDLALRVNGIEGLRVADCSVMPALTSGNTNAPTMMIADRAADAILADL